jgi:cell fate (sporulation/competence/biofilm development) regulator YlbF (YheA/YmcA/DUF963 family)
LADPEAQSQYECLSDLGQQLHDKQSQGPHLDQRGNRRFDRQRDSFANNAVAAAFVEAQEEMHRLQQQITRFVSKTLESGAVAYGGRPGRRLLRQRLRLPSLNLSQPTIPEKFAQNAARRGYATARSRPRGCRRAFPTLWSARRPNASAFTG